MPSSRLLSIASLISCTSPRRIKSRTNGVLISTSVAGKRRPSLSTTKRRETTALRFKAKFINTFLCAVSGKKFKIRSSVWSALFECKVARHKWPVSAKAMAASMVVVSKISPIRITSGASRIAFLSALWKACVSRPTSRWFTMDFLCLCKNSIGSSMVRMCPVWVSFR